MLLRCFLWFDSLSLVATAAPVVSRAGGPEGRSGRAPLPPCHPAPRRDKAGELSLVKKETAVVHVLVFLWGAAAGRNVQLSPVGQDPDGEFSLPCTSYGPAGR